MNLIKTKLDGLVVLKPTVFKDNRGYFMESYNQKNINKLLGNVNFVQDNESESSRGVLRGLHFQRGNYAQAKLVRVIKGSVLDIAVDLRKDSETFGKHFSQESIGLKPIFERSRIEISHFCEHHSHQPEPSL